MAKKPTVHNHIDRVTVNIDYDQLAKALLEEQKKTETEKKKKKSVRRSLMAWCNGTFYAALYSCVMCEVIKKWQKYINGMERSLYMCIVYTVGGVALAFLLISAQHETMNDSEENTVTHFNTSITLIALIVAIIALVKG